MLKFALLVYHINLECLFLEFVRSADDLADMMIKKIALISFYYLLVWSSSTFS